MITAKALMHINSWRGRKTSIFLAILILSSILTSCVRMEDPETTQLVSSEIISRIQLGQEFVQTFRTRHTGINSIHVWLSCDEDIGSLQLTVFNDPGLTDPITAAEVSLVYLNDGSENRIDFPEFGAEPDQIYYLKLETTGSPVDILGSSSDYYTDGQAYLDDLPIQGDMAFRTKYNYGFKALAEDLSTLIDQAFRIILFLLLITIPGIGVLSLIRRYFDLPNHAWISLVIGLSLAIFPVIFIWTSYMQIPINEPSLITLLLLLAAISTVSAAKHCTRKRTIAVFKDPTIILLLLIFISTFLVRIGMVRDLAAPPWVDSIHHGVITNMILDTGLLPAQYTPVLPDDVQNYHSGFHVNLAIFQWLTRLDIPTGMLLYGQLLNAAVIFAVFSFAQSLTRNRNAALTAALISGLMTPMPAYYTSWGRYTQLTALMLLPGAYISFKHLLQWKRLSPQWLIVTGLLVSGLFLTHYRVFAFTLMLVAADLIINFRKYKHRNSTIKIMVVFSAFVLVTLPWLLPTMKGLVIPKMDQWSGGTAPLFDGFSWRFLTSGLGLYTLVLAGFGMITVTFKKRKWGWVLILWVLLMFISANLSVLKLPFSGFINNLSVEIILFIPISILGGYFFSQILVLNRKFISSSWKFLGELTVLGMLFLLTVFGAKEQLPSINSGTILARDADMDAIQWIKNNIPGEETFLVNPKPWGYGLNMGQDGGYWIAPITLNKTIPPPVIYGFGSRETTENLNLVINSVIENHTDPDRIWDIMQDANAQYLYIGRKGGILKPDQFIDHPKFDLIYSQNGARIFGRLDS